MPYLDLNLPPGIYRNGTEYQGKGRWRDGNLIRFFEGAVRPHGGWRKHSLTSITGAGRAIFTWRAKDLTSWCAVGTEQKLYSMSPAGTLSDVTPSGFVAGIADALAGGGYGTGVYGGAWNYGTPGLDTTQIQDATVASLDNWGQDLIFCTADDGKLYQWQRNVAVQAAQIANSPTGCRGTFVTDERFLVALGGGGDPRNVQWSDQGDNTTWSPSTTNQAGAQTLQSIGKLMLGKRIKGASLILTDFEAYLMTYVGGVAVYGFTMAGSGCGAASQRAAAVFDGNCAWMGKNGFWVYAGYVLPIPCEVSDYVFGSAGNGINLQQISKVSAHVDSNYGEITWHYPSSVSNENDSYVTWSYREWERGRSVWSFGTYARVSGVDRGAFGYPLRVGTDGYVYDHEVGFSYTGAAAPYVESAPFELGNGDNVMHAMQLIPDEATEGDVSATFKVKFYPNGSETSFGPYTSSTPTDVRFCGRQAKMHLTGVGADDWRVGNYRLQLVAGGLR